MRVTNRMMHDTVLRNLQSNSTRLNRLQNQISSAKRLSQPSDDPSQVGRALDLRSIQMSNEQYLKNVDLAKSWLNSTDSALQSVVSATQRARELVVRASNQALRPDDLSAVRKEMEEIFRQTVALANTRFGEQFIFAGHKTLATPFTIQPDNTVDYSGDSGELERSIAPDIRVSIGVSGDRGFPELFAAFRDILDLLDQQDATALGSNGLAQLDAAIAKFTDLLAEVGAKTNRIETMADRLSGDKVNIADLLSKTEDLDMAEAISELVAQETVYQAALETGGRVIKSSLFDFLR